MLSSVFIKKTDKLNKNKKQVPGLLDVFFVKITSILLKVTHRIHKYSIWQQRGKTLAHS